jgi:hypothetical protein
MKKIIELTEVKEKKTKRTYKKKVKPQVVNEESKDIAKKIYTPYELFGCEGLENNSGWAGLVRPFLHKVEKYNKDEINFIDGLFDHRVTISQIKEKYGGLRIYHYGPEEFHTYSNMCEKASYHICEHCGSPFHVGMYQGGWIETVCINCAKADNKYGYNYEYTFVDRDTGKQHIIFGGDKKDIYGAYLKLREKLKIDVMGICFYDLKNVEKYPLWKEYYHSVKMDWIIRFALKTQKFIDCIVKLKGDIRYKIWYFWRFKLKINNKK